MSAKRRKGSGPSKPSKNLKQVIDPILAKALSHPLRSHILATLGDRIASPTEIARELEIDARDLNYHIRVLVEIGMIRLVGTEKRRGALEHFYTLSSRIAYLDDCEWRQMPEPVRASLAGSLLRLAMEEAVEALLAGTFTAEDSHQSRTTLLLHERGRTQLARLMEETLEKVIDIGKACAADLEKAPAKGIPVEVFMMEFETVAATAGAPEDGAGSA